MPGSLTRFLCSCASPFSHDDDRDDPSLWARDLRRCSGVVSAAVIQANQVLEDQCRVESGDFGTFVGVFDGHGGPDAARYACDHLFEHYIDISLGADSLTDNSIRQAFLATEEGFINVVSQLWSTQPDIATCGTCCLVGVIQRNTMRIANAGDSRAVLGRKVGHKVEAVQLSTEHNANLEEIRREMKARHPDDSQIVEFKHGVWRIKGIIQVSRSLGDAYMKYAEYNREPIKPKFRISEPFISPILTADPTIISREIQPNDSFVIFASDGLWEHLSNQEAVDIVHSHPHAGIARRLIKAALQDAARKREMRYSDLISIDKKVRRHFHDDITVIVVFLNHDPFQGGRSQTGPTLSLRSPLDN
ncbi:hypothetical protein LUZ63_017419 [Rhynchospora breviuscula]|uniref:protein-serine/threonine phosphatase n=1 Tax=Rhynchospora breviuscula TaxID=2022672 RepID=A0A9Q0C2F1_9POAL|nr:hypothetical protein LUZ63_017419 [Rhynchospora breviuscula]